jgi:hypothetical protein
MTTCENIAIWKIVLHRINNTVYETEKYFKCKEDYPQKAHVLNCGFVEWILIWKLVNVYWNNDLLRSVTEVNLNWKSGTCFATIIQITFLHLPVYHKVL